MDILIVEDLKLANDSLCEVVSHGGVFNSVFSAYDGNQALEIYKHHHPEIVLLDVEIPRKSGILVAHKILNTHMRTKVIMMTAFENETTICNIRNLRGITGCILKSEHGLHDFPEIIHKVVQGGQFFSSKFSKLVHQFLSSNLCLGRILSSEQRKLLCYIGAGYRDEDIAHELGYSFSKVRGQVRRLREKLNAADRIDLISIAQDCGCAKPEWKQMGLVGNYEQYD